MRRTAFRIIAFAIFAIGAVGCGEGTNPDGPTGTGGSGGITIIPGPGGAGGGEGGAGGVGGAGGEEPGADFQIDTVHPSYGTVDGGTRVTITGSGFVASVPDESPGASTVVLFGDNPSIDVRVVDDSTIYATSPVGLVGDVDVVVQNSSGEQRCAGCFHYLPPLKLEALVPGTGHVDGGERITLRGQGLTEDAIVLFGTRAALAPERNQDGSLSVTLPPADEPGLVDVRVVSASRQSLLRRAFRYRTDLRIEGIEPPVGWLAGGETVVVRGEGFTPSTRIFFGEVEVPVRLGETGLEVTVPRGSAPGAIQVEAMDGTSSAFHPFVYLDPAATGFALYAVAPDRGPVEGGNEITLLGSGFDAGGLVAYFDDIPLDSLMLESGNVARVLAPEGTAGTVDVRVRTAEGMKTLPDAYRYVPSSTLSEVTPSSGPVEGGTRISIHGTNFPENPRVFVGAFEATEVVRVRADQIDAVTPPGSDGPVSVRVVDAAAPEHKLSLRNAFTYEGPLALAVVDPASGARAGGTRVFVRGTGFRGEMKVYFGPNEAESVVVLDPYTLEVLTPRGNTGLVDLRVEREDGAVAELEGAFNYFNPSSSYGGSSGGPLSGVLNVTALALSGPNQNGPIEGCTVYVGADESTRLVKETDDRGQATFSSPSLVKAVSLTVHCENYEIATVANQVSENVTVLLEYIGPGDEEPPDDAPPPPVTILAGNVYGFKLPPSRTLEPHEEEVARVGAAYASVYNAPPFGNQTSFTEITSEGGLFTFQSIGRPIYTSVYAVYGIKNTLTDEFEPLLFGYARGISVPLGEKKLDVQIILDTRLDYEVPVTIENPPWGARNSVMVTAFLDLGADGVIPLGEAFNDRAPDEALLTHLPWVSGESVVFQALGHTQGSFPYSISFRRQGGDLSQGVTIGPLLGPVTITEPFLFPTEGASIGFFDGVFEWEIEPSPEEPDVITIAVLEPGNSLLGTPPIPQWHAVLPGNERRVVLPDAVRDALRAKYGGQTALMVQFATGSQPKFDFPEWNYVNTGLGNFNSFTYHVFGIVP